MGILDTHVDEVVSALERRSDELSSTIATRMLEEVDEIRSFASPQLYETLQGTTRTALQSELSFMRHGREVPRTCPADVAEAARLAADARMPATVVLRTHRIGHEVVWHAFLAELGRLELSDETEHDVLDAVSRFLFRYVDALATFVEAEHERELARLRPSSEKMRARAVLDLLEGRTNAANGLAYDLSCVHLACAGSGTEAAAALQRLASLLGRRLLLVHPTDDTAWAWLGGTGPCGDLGRVLADFEPGDAVIGLGEPAAGSEGFRASHWQALAAHGIARRRETALARYKDVAFEALALRDERSARHFVELELGGLERDDRAATLKETLRTYFACAQNAAATAAALGIHEQTVAQRLRAVEERIGGSVNARRTQLDAALRVEPLLTGEDMRGT